MSRRPSSVASMPVAVIALVVLGGCGTGLSQTQREVALAAAEECAERAGVPVTAAPPAGFAAQRPTPATVAPVIGVAGDPPLALGYRSADASQTLFAVVPSSSKPGRTTAFAALKEQSGPSWLLVPAGRELETRRCLGGSQG